MIQKIVSLNVCVFMASFALANSDSGSQIKNVPAVSEIENIPIDGSYLKAYGVAYSAFLKDSDIKKTHKNILNYSVSFSKSGDTLNVTFGSKLAPGEPRYSGGEGKLGKDVEYQISANNFKVLKRFFFK